MSVLFFQEDLLVTNLQKLRKYKFIMYMFKVLTLVQAREGFLARGLF